MMKESKSMTKKEVKNFFTREALTLLENSFNIDVEGGGRCIHFEVEVNGITETGTLERDTLNVDLDNTMNYFNPEAFPKEMVLQTQKCKVMERNMNLLLEDLAEEYGDLRRNS
tara:strand:+ start:1326 stop:1664 length:339 start_codon:yes stop_codon:yes gene_type:complete